jgi:hypothetical protein
MLGMPLKNVFNHDEEDNCIVGLKLLVSGETL